MKAQCISAVEQAIGRSITAAESRTIEQRVEDAQVALARRDPAAWRALSKQDQLLQAAQYAAVELRSEALKKKQRIALTIQAHDRIENYTKAQVAAGHDETRLDALERMLAPQPDGKSNVTPVEYAAKGRMAVAMGQLDATWEAIKPRMMSFFANREAEAQLTRAVHGDTAGIQPEILKAARAWLDVAGMLRDSYVAAGGDVGRLDNWGMPHSWEPTLLLKRGKDRYVDDMMRWVDRRVYLHEDGQPYTDAEMREFLGAAWLTSVTDGANKRVRTDTPGGSIKANRHSQSRQLHFRDGAAALEALRTYSGRNLFESMVGHVRQMARDTALLEQFGPNADLAVDHFIQRIREEEARANPQNAAKFERRARRVENIYNRLAGNDPPPANEWIANGFAALRSIMSAAKLGSAPITSLADEGTMYLTAHVNNIPAVKVFLNEVRAFNPLDRVEHDMARRAGLMVGTMMDSVNRFGGDALGWEIPNRVSNAFMRISGLNAMTEARRRAFSVTMMDTIGTLTRNHADVSKLDPNDWRILRSKGITPEEWAIWRAAEPDTWGGNHTVLTPDSIFALTDEQMRAAIAPTLERMSAEVSAQIDALGKRVMQEIDWQGGRAKKFADYQQKKLDELDEFVRRREDWSAEDSEAVAELRAVSEALQEQAKSEAEIVRAFREAENQQVMREILYAVEDGMDPAKAMGRVSFATAGATTDATNRGRQLGQALAAARKKVTDASATARRREHRYQAQIENRSEVIGRLIGKRMQELDEFKAKSDARIQKFNEIAESLRDRAPNLESRAITVARERAATKLLAVVMEEQDLAVIEPGTRERVAMYAGTQPGTFGGELARSFFQFKSFPLAVLFKHWKRGLSMYDGLGGKVGYLGTFIAATTLMGAVSMEINDIISGRDPRTLNPASQYGPRNWLAAFLKGGSLGIYGDFLFADSTSYGRTLVGAVGGPTLGLVEDVDDLVRGNIVQSIKGEETDFGAEALKFARGMTPGANLWYTKAVTDRVIFQQLQEYFSPGFLARQQQRSFQNYGTTYWWAPGESPAEVKPVNLQNIAAE